MDINHNSGKGMNEKFPNFLKNLFDNSKKKDNKLNLFSILEWVDIYDDFLEYYHN